MTNAELLWELEKIKDTLTALLREKESKPRITTVQVAWKTFYTTYSQHELLRDAHFESLCVGFCVAMGMKVEDAFAFYQKQIAKGLF